MRSSACNRHLQPYWPALPFNWHSVKNKYPGLPSEGWLNHHLRYKPLRSKGACYMYRICIFFVTIILLLPACSVTSAPVTPLPSSLPITQTPMAPPASQTGPFGQLEVISSQNWARLQLVQSFPAEMLRDQFRAAI